MNRNGSVEDGAKRGEAMTTVGSRMHVILKIMIVDKDMAFFELANMYSLGIQTPS